MNILLLNQAFYPDVVSTAQHASDLARALVNAGHQVTVVCSSHGYDDPRIHFPKREMWAGVNIVRIRATGFGKGAKWRRATDFATFMWNCALEVLLLPRFDVVVAMTSPPLISFLASLAVPRKSRNFVVWCMDLNPDEALAAGWLSEKSITARLLSWMLAHSLQRADRIIVLDRFMEERIEKKGIPREKLLVMPPWSHDDHVRFDNSGREEFRTAHNFSDKFVVMYSGNHGPCHPLETLLQAAERLTDRKDIMFCFVGGGSEFPRIQDRVRVTGMGNVLCLPYQPINKLSASLSAGDLHVIVMGNEYVGIVHPCKIYNVLAVNRAFLYIGPEESHICDINCRAGPDAYVSAHGDVDGVVENILRAMHRLRTESPATMEVGKQFTKEMLIPQMIFAIEQTRKVNGGATVSAVRADRE